MTMSRASSVPANKMDPVRTVFMFPGQSSRDPSMIERLVASRPACLETIEHASDIVGRDLLIHYRSDNPAVFNTNKDIQIGVFLANHLYRELLRESGVTGDLSLGLSLGEYNHLVDIGALRLVVARGAAYDAGPPGSMAVFPGLSEPDVRTLLSRVQGSCIEISNYNSPSQHVITGDRDAVEQALAIAEDEFFTQGVIIEANIAMHCSVFAPVARVYNPLLAAASWQPTRGPYIPNVSAEIIYDPATATFVRCLTRHVYQPVLWRQSLETIAARYAQAVFIEVGPRSVLFNLLNDRWFPRPKYKTDGPEEPRRQAYHIAQELEELANAG